MRILKAFAARQYPTKKKIYRPIEIGAHSLQAWKAKRKFKNQKL